MIRYYGNGDKMRQTEGEPEKRSEEPVFRSLEFNFNDWKLGGKLIFISTLLAIISLFFTWIDSGDQSEIGFLQGGSIFLAMYIYPFLILAQDKHMNKVLGVISGASAVLFPILLLNYMSRQMMEPMMDIAGLGLIIFIITGIILLVGVIKYVPYDRYGTEERKRGKPCPSCDKPMVYENEWGRWYCENCDKYD